MSEWKPCPFCGSTKLWRDRDNYLNNGIWCWIVCDGCGATGPDVKDNDDEASQKWNHRAGISPLPEWLIDRVRRLEADAQITSAVRFRAIELMHDILEWNNQLTESNNNEGIIADAD